MTFTPESVPLVASRYLGALSEQHGVQIFTQVSWDRPRLGVKNVGTKLVKVGEKWLEPGEHITLDLGMDGLPEIQSFNNGLG